ncbi:GNAT family N-acetyltransferase [Planctomicrobium sp. SH668]|uniref:GNAT family N-acetyltransferase n=1 Tax=Planctomicrobium sp. SH668 TaxID=3448126 RepID=UPI003F5B4ABE
MKTATANYPTRFAKQVPITEVTPEFIEDWRQLAQSAVDPNPFLEPEFVLSQHQHVKSGTRPDLWYVKDEAGKLMLLGLFQAVEASSVLPFPHLISVSSPYQFQTGILVRREYEREAVFAFLTHLKTSRYRHGLILDSICVESRTAERIYTAAALIGFSVQLQNNWLRAALDLSQIDTTQSFEASLSKSRRKSLKGALAKLQKKGTVSFRCIDSAAEVKHATERFLKLEQLGWKSNLGTAIACNESHRAFFEKVANDFSTERKILFGELLIDDQVIASTCNFVEGDTVFAFKIGWNQEYRDGSPGIWAEIYLANYLMRHRPEITMINSCSSAGSYLDRLWPHRIPMGAILLTQSQRAELYKGVRNTLRIAKQKIWPSSGSSPAMSHSDSETESR